MKKIVRLLFASAFLLTSVSANAGIIASDSFDGSKYTVYDNSGITWEAAQSIALVEGGYLAAITSALENDFVTALIQGENLGQVWAGGFQIQSNPGVDDPADDWFWDSGETWDWTNWNSPTEPNDYYGFNSEQHLGINWTSDGKWNDEANLGNIHGFVVEKAVPEPSVIALFALGLLGLGFARRRMRV